MTIALENRRTFGGFNVDDVTSAPLRVEKVAELTVDRATLFNYLVQHEQWTNWFEIIDSVSVNNAEAELPGGNGALRTCNFKDGTSCNERIYAYSEPERFAYAITGENPFGVDGHLALIDLTESGEGVTTLNYYQYYNHPAPEEFAANVDMLLTAGITRLIDIYGGEILR